MTESIYGPSWYAATMVAAPERERLVYNLDVDACVVGGGLAGLTAARELARRGWSVALLEARRVAWNASGRNAGIVAPGFAERIEHIIERIGFERARALWILSAGGVDYVHSTIRETQMPGVSPVEGWLKVQRSNNPEKMYGEAELIGARLGTEVEVWSTDQVRSVLDSAAYFQALHFPGALHIHPLNYAIGLAAAAEDAGARIFEETRAVEIDPSGVRKRIRTAGAMVRANHVVLAGSAHLGSLFPIVAGSVLPVASYVATTEPLGERVHDAIRYSGAVVDTRHIGDGYRIVDGDRLMWSGGMSSRLESPRGLPGHMRKAIRKVYPQLGEVEIAHAWNGVMGYAVHMMPLIGEVSPGLWVATAFGGHGLNTSAMAGELIARAIVEGDDHWRLFASYDLVYAGDRFGRAASQVVYWFLRAADVIGETLAFQRDAARRRREAAAARAAEEARGRTEAEAARLAVEEAARSVAAAQERLATRAAVHHAADAATYLAVQEARQREADQAEWFAQQQAERLAAAEAERQASERAEAERFAREQAERRAAADAEWQAAEQAARRALEQATRDADGRPARFSADEAEAERRVREQADRRAAADAERQAAEQARRALEQATRAADEQSARIAADQAAHRIEQEAARLAAEADRLSHEPAAAPAEPQDSGAREDEPAAARAPDPEAPPEQSEAVEPGAPEAPQGRAKTTQTRKRRRGVEASSS